MEEGAGRERGRLWWYSSNGICMLWGGDCSSVWHIFKNILWLVWEWYRNWVKSGRRYVYMRDETYIRQNQYQLWQLAASCWLDLWYKAAPCHCAYKESIYLKVFEMNEWVSEWVWAATALKINFCPMRHATHHHSQIKEASDGIYSSSFKHDVLTEWWFIRLIELELNCSFLSTSVRLA